ncbi:MAG TPA: sugar transferase [Syntrophales bacterium]|nr:sugar transferase [Syntrophales bacterium]
MNLNDSTYRRWGKRNLDLILSIPAFIILFSPMIFIGLFIRLKLGPPVFFCQKRPGLHGKPFLLYKFRTMTNALDEKGNLLSDERRLTPVGRFLRMTSLDELPTFWNVIKGDMSLVGPRPLRIHYMERYNEEQARRHEVSPGITGWAQVNGRNAISWEDKLKLDVWYVDYMSLRLDIRILVVTVWKIIKREGINQPGQATMEEFLGTK